MISENYASMRRTLEDLAKKSRRDYTIEELEKLKEGAEDSLSLLELQLALSRPAYGIVKKLRMLAYAEPQIWRRDWFVRYRREFNHINKEAYLEKRRNYFQNHKQEELRAKQIRRARKRKMGLRVT